MRLQIEQIEILDLKIGPKTHVLDHVLYLDLKELKEIILGDDRINDVDLNLVFPGEQVRIVNVVDVIQPRCKIGQDNEDFPGWIGKITSAGHGRTRSLEGISVILSNSYSKRAYSGIVEMFGNGAELSRYGSMKNVSISPTPSDKTEERDFESAVKIAGMKAAIYLAKAAEGHSIDKIETYELNTYEPMNSDLPKVAYYYQLYTPQHDYQGISDPILYGAKVTNMFPTLIHPNEILDGGVVNAQTVRGLETYSIQNHPVVKELYKRHRRELNFVGVVIGVASMEPIQRKRMAMIAANLISNVLGADGVILSKVHGGMARVDLSLVAGACEAIGIKTTLIVNLGHSGVPLSEGALFNLECLNAVANVGQTLEKIRLEKANTILGGTDDTVIFNPEFTQKAGDDTIEIEGFLLAGMYSYIGGSKVIAVDY